MHGAYECQPLQRSNSVQTIMVLVYQDVSDSLGEANGKKSISIVSIPFDNGFTVIEFKDRRLFRRRTVHESDAVQVGPVCQLLHSIHKPLGGFSRCIVVVTVLIETVCNAHFRVEVAKGQQCWQERLGNSLGGLPVIAPPVALDTQITIL